MKGLTSFFRALMMQVFELAILADSNLIKQFLDQFCEIGAFIAPKQILWQ